MVEGELPAVGWCTFYRGWRGYFWIERDKSMSYSKQKVRFLLFIFTV